MLQVPGSLAVTFGATAQFPAEHRGGIFANGRALKWRAAPAADRSCRGGKSGVFASRAREAAGTPDATRR
jgi:hypothetical protein